RDDNQPSGTNADTNGECKVVFTSNSAGVVTGHATVNASFGGGTFSAQTDGVLPNSPDAVKRFVDAKISITPDGVNKVGDPHTFTVLVQQDDGLTAAQGGDGVTGFAPVAGVKPAVTLTASNGAAVVAASKTDNCAGPTGTGSDGKCT